MQKLIFKTSSGGQITPEEVVREIADFMRADEKRSYKILIGTDSEAMSGNQADFVTAIVAYRVGNGGRYFWRRIVLDKIHTLRDRIWQEVLVSLDIAKDFISLTKHFDLPHFDFEIHVDIGKNGKTRDMIQELTGIIRANNFEPRTKPESYAASSVADRHNSRN